MAAAKVDFKKTLASYVPKHGRFEIVTIPDRQYLMVDGSGDPNTAPEFGQAIELLYPVAYGLKFFSKNELNRDYVVPPLEALWRSEDMGSFVQRDKSKWNWTLILMVPDWLDESPFTLVTQKIEAKVGQQISSKVRLGVLKEGLCVQTLHIGSFDEEGPVLKDMHEKFIPEAGLVMTGEHHEVYLSDFRKVAPQKLRTILRQPVKGSTEGSATLCRSRSALTVYRF